jgi:hypothetical protein
MMIGFGEVTEVSRLKFLTTYTMTAGHGTYLHASVGYRKYKRATTKAVTDILVRARPAQMPKFAGHGQLTYLPASAKLVPF